VLGFAGTVVVLAPWENGAPGSVGGAAPCLLASASYGLSYVYMDRYLIPRRLPALALSAAQLLAATAAMLVLVPFADPGPGSVTLVAVASLLILGVLGTGAAYVVNYRILADDGATAASTVTYLLPVVAVALGALVLGEPVGPELVVGSALVLAGVAVARRSGGARSRPPVEVVDRTGDD
jgi:drug/metabolite transporter (DMT)-like permease